MTKKKQNKRAQTIRKAQKKRRNRLKEMPYDDYNGPICRLCGATENLTRTECCDNWICDDEDEYVLFSYERNSCYRNHRRYTLCGYHDAESHPGDWINCRVCREDFEKDLEMYVYYGTNEYNFKVLPHPPKFQPAYCSKCGVVIDKGLGGFSGGPEGMLCWECTELKFGKCF